VPSQQHKISFSILHEKDKQLQENSTTWIGAQRRRGMVWWVSFLFHILKTSIETPDNTHYLLIHAFSRSLRKIPGKCSKLDHIDLYPIILLGTFILLTWISIKISVSKGLYIFFFSGTTAPISALSLPPWNSPFHFGFLDLGHSVGLLGRVISSSQGLYLHTNTEKRTHTHKH
jgi:hypothetical protein